MSLGRKKTIHQKKGNKEQQINHDAQSQPKRKRKKQLHNAICREAGSARPAVWGWTKTCFVAGMKEKRGRMANDTPVIIGERSVQGR